jgi:acyl-CoA synthetase (AMP-forming)/AMP-acid ligase II
MQMYGMVEAVPPVSILCVEDHRIAIEEGEGDWLRSAGVVCTTVQVEVRDDDGQVLAPGEIGEVFVGGDNVMDGYWAAGTSEIKAVSDGWLSTGDVGYLSETHRLHLVNRKGDMIITGGYNVYPSEVENAIRAVPGVADVVVFGVPDNEWGQIVAAAYVPDGAHDIDDATVADHCRTLLAPYKKPRIVRQLESFPVTSTGKIARGEVMRNLVAELT